MRLYNNPILIVTLLAFVLVSSCNKDDEKIIIVQGKITDANQHTAISNAEVTFWSSRIQSGTYNPNYVALASSFTDAAGNYSLQITKEKDAGFRITVDKEKYFGNTQDLFVDDLPSGTHQINYSIYPEAHFKMNVKNSAPNDNTDFINYWFFNTQPNGANCCNNVPINFTGQSYENTLNCRTFGGQQIVVKWIVKKAGVTTPYETSIFCVPFDTTVFNLNY